MAPETRPRVIAGFILAGFERIAKYGDGCVALREFGLRTRHFGNGAGCIILMAYACTGGMCTELF